MSSDNSTSRAELEAPDANDLKQNSRLKSILERQDQVQDKESDAYDLYVNGASRHAVNVLLLRVLKQYIREAYNLLLEYHEEKDEDDTNYLTGVKLGRIEMEHDDDIVFMGLQDILDADDAYYESWTETVKMRHGPDQVREFEREYTVPETVLDNGFLLTRKFLGQEMDMDLTLEEMEDAEDAEFDYSDLLRPQEREAVADD